MIQSNVDVSTLTSQAAFNKLESLSRTRSDEKEIDRVAGEFQSMCYSQLVKAMFATTEGSALWGDSHAAGILHSMFIEAISHAGGAESLNIRSSIEKSLYKTMGVESAPEMSNTPLSNDHSEEISLNKKESINVLL